MIRPSASSASHLDGGPTGADGVTSCSQGLGGPGGGQRAGGRGHPPHRVQGQRQTGLCGSGGGPQREHRVPVGLGGAGQHHLAVHLDDALGEQGTARPAPTGCRRRAWRAAGAARHGDLRTQPTSRQVTSLA